MTTDQDHLILFHIQLPKNKNVAAFVKFMRDEYLPAVHKGPTRVGQLTGLQLFERDDENGEDNSHEFFWHVYRSGLLSEHIGVDDEGVARKFEAFGAVIKHLGSFQEMASWHMHPA